MEGPVLEERLELLALQDALGSVDHVDQTVLEVPLAALVPLAWWVTREHLDQWA